MRIDEVRNNYYNSKSIGFNSIERSVIQKHPKIPFLKTVKHKNTSWLFRPGADYCKKLYNYFSKVFSDIKKVNVYNYGCSLGYEAYSFIIGMHYIDNKNFEKFLPIIAKDYDEEIVKEAKTYKIPIDYFYELTDMENHFCIIDSSEYFNLHPLYNNLREPPSWKYMADVKNVLKNNVEFSVADIRKDYVNIKPNNSIVIATNFWPYMSANDRKELAFNLYNQLGNNSYVLIGNFDTNKITFRKGSTADVFLTSAGFKSTEIPNLFVKQSNVTELYHK